MTMARMKPRRICIVKCEYRVQNLPTLDGPKSGDFGLQARWDSK
jgi:hypothetical protein